MFSNPVMRIVIGAPLALVVTLFLLHGMRLLIAQDFVEPDDIETYVLEPITPQEMDGANDKPTQIKPLLIVRALKPPPPPKYSASKTKVDLPAPNLERAVPTELPPTRGIHIAINPIAITNREPQPIRPATPTYPQSALANGIEGKCDVRFDIDTRGRPYNIAASCTDAVFKRSAEKAVRQSEFAPKILDGQAVEHIDAIYPIEYALTQ